MPANVVARRASFVVERRGERQKGILVMGRHSTPPDIDNPIRDRVYEVRAFHRQGEKPETIAEWLCVDLADVLAIIADDYGYQVQHGVTPTGLGGVAGGRLPTPDEIAHDMAIFRAMRQNGKDSDGAKYYHRDEYKKTTVPRPTRPRRGY
jgi:hypothetical protein